VWVTEEGEGTTVGYGLGVISGVCLSGSMGLRRLQAVV
jgi:hypothetical protein